jgi:hypothetical protein
MITILTAWINDFTACTEHPLDHCDLLANGFGKTMEKCGHKWSIKQTEKTAKAADWISRKAPKSFDLDLCPDKGDDAASGSGVDTVDFALIASHGAMWVKDRTHPHLCTIGFGSKPCRFCSTQVQFGDGKLKWLILDACHTLEVNGPKGFNPWSVWRSSFHGLHMIFGFTSQSSDSWWSSDRTEFFATQICNGEEMAEAWIRCAFSYWEDQYPVAAAAGKDSSDADTRLETETINSALPSIQNKDVKAMQWMWRS